MTSEEAKSILTTTTWSPETLEIAMRGRFKCEYCGQDFFDSVNSYYTFQRGHIVPKGKGRDTPDNLAASCQTCNFLKRRWDPRTTAGELATREQLVEVTKLYISKKRQEKELLIRRERELAARLVDSIAPLEMTSSGRSV